MRPGDWSAEKGCKPRPDDRRLPWVLGRMYLIVVRTDEKVADARSLLEKPPVRTNGGVTWPSTGGRLHMASQSDDHAKAPGHLRQYATGHLAVQCNLPSEVDETSTLAKRVVAHYSALGARTCRGDRMHEGRRNGDPGARKRARACATRLN